MKKHVLILIIALAMTASLFAQIKAPLISQPPKSIARLHLIAPGMGVEQTISNNSTLIFDFTLGFTYNYSNVNGNVTTSSDIIPQIKLESRKYTNIEERGMMGKRTDYYSGRYWAIQGNAGYSLGAEMGILSAGVLWGFQTTLGNKGYFDIGIGPGLGYANGTIGLTAVGNFALGFIVN